VDATDAYATGHNDQLLRRGPAARPEELRELLAARGAGLGVDVGQVEPGRAARDEQRVRDLGVAQALQQQGRDLPLPIGQQRERVGSGVAVGRRAATYGPASSASSATRR